MFHILSTIGDASAASQIGVNGRLFISVGSHLSGFILPAPNPHLSIAIADAMMSERLERQTSWLASVCGCLSAYARSHCRLLGDFCYRRSGIDWAGQDRLHLLGGSCSLLVDVS